MDSTFNQEAAQRALTVIGSEEQGSDAYEAACKALHEAMGNTLREQLAQLVQQGPVWDGNVVSKSGRDAVMRMGLASRVCVKGEQGYTAANYVGWDVHKAGQV